jgi:hypothetical protein
MKDERDEEKTAFGAEDRASSRDGLGQETRGPGLRSSGSKALVWIVPLVLLAAEARASTEGDQDRGPPDSEVAVGVDLGPPYKLAVAGSLLVGRVETNVGPGLAIDHLSGFLLEGRLGTNGGSVGLGYASSVERRLLGFTLVAELHHGWRGLGGDPWQIAPGESALAAVGRVSFVFAEIGAGVLWRTERSAASFLAFVGFRYAVHASSR